MQLQIRLMFVCSAIATLSGCGEKKSESSFVLPPPASVESETLVIPPGKAWVEPVMTVSTDVKVFKPNMRVKVTVTATIKSTNPQDLPSSLRTSLVDASGKIYSGCRPQPRSRTNTTYVMSGFIDTPKAPGVYHLKPLAIKTLIVTDKTGATQFFDQKRELPEIVVDTR